MSYKCNACGFGMTSTDLYSPQVNYHCHNCNLFNFEIANENIIYAQLNVKYKESMLAICVYYELMYNDTLVCSLNVKGETHVVIASLSFTFKLEELIPEKFTEQKLATILTFQ